MEAYSDFALVYDELMDNIPYDEWTEKIEKVINQYGISKPQRSVEVAKEDTEEALESERNLVLDLACGTGNIATRLYDKGFDVIGVDLSPDMLAMAYEKNYEADREIMYLNQDMRELELYSTIGTAVCVCDSLNYITDYDDLVCVLKNVENYLYPKGLFIFDINSDTKYSKIGESVIAENRDDVSFIWENTYDEGKKLNRIDLTLFSLDEETGMYYKTTEAHEQRGYTADEIKLAVKEAGLELVLIEDMDGKEITENTERIFVVARECKK